MNEEIIRFEKITKIFDDNIILDKVDFSIRKGEVHALLGQNGAGKSTLVRILAGVLPFEDGRIWINGKSYSKLTPAIANKNGITVLLQEPCITLELTVFENIFFEERLLFKNSEKYFREKLPAYLASLASYIEPYLTMKARNINLAQRQITQIIKALIDSRDIIVLDEPMAYFTDVEIDLLKDILNKLKTLGKTIILISHRIDSVYKMADAFTIIKNGKHFCTQRKDSCTIEELIGEYIGTNARTSIPKLPVKIRKEILRVQKLYGGSIKDFSFSLREGEILGLAGIVGSGRSTLARLLIGAGRIDRGLISIGGKNSLIRSPIEALSRGCCYLPQDRNVEGLFLYKDVSYNIAEVNNSYYGIGSTKYFRKITQFYIKLLGIYGSHPDMPISTLSSGNKQKVLFARGLYLKPKLFILDEPTAGIDAVGKIEIYNIINFLLKRGAAVLLISSDFSELVGLCDRILVLNDGNLVREINKNIASPELLYKYCCGIEQDDLMNFNQ
ncbi:MAG: sugar ABC transporter ATP-binding protein [Christensenellales bacterium]